MKLQSIFKICGIVLLSICIQNCGTNNKIQAIKPEAVSKSNIAYLTKTSYVGMPVEIKIKDIQKALNQNLVGLIYHDSILADDDIEMKIWKQSNIELSYEKGKIKSELPLKIWIKYKYGTNFMGLNDTREFNLSGKITLQSLAGLSNWKLKTQSTIEKTQWNESPTVQIAGKQMAITYIVNPALNWFKKDIAQKIDDAILKTCDFKPQVTAALKKLSEPYLANEGFETWLTINPSEVYATDAQLMPDKVVMNLGLKCAIQTLIGDKPKQNTNWDKVAFTRVKNIPNNFNGTVAAISTYASASRVITNNFKGQTFASGNKKITIDHVELWQKNSNMIIALTMNGSLNGTIYLSGLPKFNSETQELYFENLDYVLDTKNVLHKSANWLLNGIILKKIQENCKYSIAQDLQVGKQTMQPFLNNYSPIKGVFINGKLDNLEFEKFELLDNAIVSFIKASGNVNIKIDGME